MSSFFKIFNRMNANQRNAGNMYNTHTVKFFDIYTHETSRIRLSDVEPVACYYDGTHIYLTHENLGRVKLQFENKSKELMIDYGLVDSFNKADSIMNRMGQRNANPDSFPEFKNYIEGNFNGVKAYFETFLHPLSLLTSIPNALSNIVVREFVDNPNDIKNINKLNDFVYSGLLVQKQYIYRSHLKDMLLTFSSLKRVYDTGRCCRFVYDTTGISHVEQI